jgi:hypothetical protein
MADDESFSDIGLHISDAGLAFQVASLLVFIALCGIFARTCYRRRDELDVRFADLRASKRFRFFLYCMLTNLRFMQPRAFCCWKVALDVH